MWFNPGPSVTLYLLKQKPNVARENSAFTGTNVVLGDICYWKGQLKKTRSWNILSWKFRDELGNNEVGKF